LVSVAIQPKKKAPTKKVRAGVKKKDADGSEFVSEN